VVTCIATSEANAVAVLVSGRDLTWYGPSLATARPDVLTQIHGDAWASGTV
jgi:hypothetical protein